MAGRSPAETSLAVFRSCIEPSMCENVSEISFAASVISPITDVGFHQEKRTIDGNSKWHPEWVEVENTTTGYKTRWRCEFGYIDNGQIKFCKKKEF